MSEPSQNPLDYRIHSRCAHRRAQGRGLAVSLQTFPNQAVDQETPLLPRLWHPGSWTSLALCLLLSSCALPAHKPNPKTVTPPLPPRPLFSKLLVAPAPPKPSIPLKLPQFQFSSPEQLKYHWWRLMRSTDLVHWNPVCAWYPGMQIEMLLPQGEARYLMRVESYVPPTPQPRIIDPSPL